MGALPKKKITRAQKGRRLASYKLKAIHPATCTRCRAAKHPHTVCKQCGYYKGRLMVGEPA